MFHLHTYQDMARLDTSDYYPKSTLDDIDEVAETVTAAATLQSAPFTPISAHEEGAGDGDCDNGDGYEKGIGELQPEGNGYKVVDFISTALSWILVPLLMPLYGLWAAFGLSLLSFIPMGVKVMLTLVTAGFTIAIPALLIFLMKKSGMITDVGLNIRKERFIPYIICIIGTAATGFFMWYKGAPMWLAMFFGGGALAGLINFIVNFRWKISAHAAGAAGITAFILRIISLGYPLPNAYLWLVISILLAGLLGSARIWLGRHTPLQVLCGYAVGFLCVYLLTMI